MLTACLDGEDEDADVNVQSQDLAQAGIHRHPSR